METIARRKVTGRIRLPRTEFVPYVRESLLSIRAVHEKLSSTPKRWKVAHVPYTLRFEVWPELALCGWGARRLEQDGPTRPGVSVREPVLKWGAGLR
jgi:hypothetical protein